MSIEAIAWAFKQPIKPAAKKFVLVALADNADHYGICFPSYRHIMQKTSLTRAAVINNIRALVNEGVIMKAGRIRGDGSDTSNAYRLPIIDGCIDDHPLSGLFISGGVYEIAPPVYEQDPGVLEQDPEGLADRPREPSSNLQLTEKEKKALSRDEFIRQVNKVFHDGELSAFSLTESEINIQAAACFDHWAADGKYPSGCAMAAFRGWIRRGIADKRIKADKVKTASNGSQLPDPEHPLQPWQERIRPIVGEAVFRSWFLKMTLEGDRLIAPTKFHADWVSDRHTAEITAILGENITITHKQEKELCTA